MGLKRRKLKMGVVLAQTIEATMQCHARPACCPGHSYLDLCGELGYKYSVRCDKREAITEPTGGLGRLMSGIWTMSKCLRGRVR